MMAEPRIALRKGVADAWLVLSAAFTLIAPTLMVVLRKDTAGGTLLAGVGIASIILVRLADIIELSGFGVSAKLAKTVQETEVTLEGLRELAGRLAEPIVAEVAMHGQTFNRMNFSDQCKQIDGIAETLRALSMPEPEVRKTLDFWCYATARKYINLIYPRVSEQPKEELSNLRKSDSLVLTYGAVQAILDRHEIRDPEVQAIAADLKELLETGRVRRPDIFPVGISI